MDWFTCPKRFAVHFIQNGKRNITTVMGENRHLAVEHVKRLFGDDITVNSTNEIRSISMLGDWSIDFKFPHPVTK